jgi:hypothetical protein
MTWDLFGTHFKRGRLPLSERRSLFGDELPGDIPSRPDKAYAEAGWVGYRDWLGYAQHTSRARA